MELRQFRYFVRIVELGSFGRAAADLGVVQSALSQQIARLETELSTRLLLRTGKGVAPTEAGLAFLREAQLTIRHADEASRAAKEARLSGSVSIGLPPTTASVLALPLICAMRERHPHVRLHLVESLSGHLANLLNARQLDLAILYGPHHGRRWTISPILEERLFFIQSAHHPFIPDLPPKIRLADLKDVPLILPSGPHGLRTVIEAACVRSQVKPTISSEIDSLTILMDAVDSGFGATLQPGAATRRYADASERFQLAEIADEDVHRACTLCGLSPDELSPAAVAAKVILASCARDLVNKGNWIGARTIDS